MPGTAIKTRQRHLRLFFSAELAGGTEFKNRRPVEDFSEKEAWTDRFELFMRDFNEDFKTEVAHAREAEADQKETTLVPPPRLWKIHGDALMFTELTYTDQVQSLALFRTAVEAFIQVAQRHDEELRRDGMGLKGCVWTAGFPIRNRHVQLVQDDVELFLDDDKHDMPVPIVASWIGRDMDLGLRLCRDAHAGRVTCSLDVAHYMMLSEPQNVEVFCVGWRHHPDILGGLTYPVLWLETIPGRNLRDPWDFDRWPECREFTFTGPLSKERFDELAVRMRASLPQLIPPYMASGNITNQARDVHEAKEARHILRILGSSTEELDVSAPPGTVSLISSEDLNQILVNLQEREEKAATLRELLMAIANDRSYRMWERRDQYDGKLFKLPSDFENPRDVDKEHRLLEAMRLVVDDVLRVKLVVRDDQVFMTDGLWVPSSIQVFPFADESDLVLDECSSLVTDDFPVDCVIDVATRCGFNALRYAGTGHVRRYGFDRSARAVIYAAINSLINNVPDFTAGVRRVQQGIARVFDGSGPENVLVTVNMPFALVPTTQTIGLANDGGERGYEKTMRALEEIIILARHLHPQSEMRAAILVYSVGRKDTDKWYVAEEARRLFGHDRVTWRKLDQKMWRINGRKEQKNPMPLTKLHLKADCMFHVRNDVNRPAMKRNYRALTRTLKSENHTHLVYGILGIRGITRDWALHRTTDPDQSR